MAEEQYTLKDVCNSIDGLYDAIETDSMGTDDVYGFTANGNLGQIAYNLNAIKKELENISGILMANMKSK